MVAWILDRVAGWLAHFTRKLLVNDDNPKMIGLRRRGIAIARENSWLYHELARRIFVADDVDGVASCLIDVSDRQTIKWLHQHYLRRLPRMPGRPPLVIDLGVNDGLFASMSLNLVQLGWNAILVEPLSDMMALARSNLEVYRRPSQTLVFIEAAMGERDGEGAFETDNPTDLGQMEGHLRATASATSRRVPMISADTFLSRPDVADLLQTSGPMVLSVDIEGQDMIVAARLLELGLRPEVILFEVIHVRAEDLVLFSRHGYEKVAHIGWNHVYVRVGAMAGTTPPPPL